MPNQLSMKVIKEDNKQFSEYIEIPLTAQGTEYTVKLYPFFAPEKVAKLRNEYFNFSKKAKEEKLDILDEEFDDFIGYLIVKYFTDIKMTKSQKAKVVYDEFKEAINSKLFEIILKSIPEESKMYVHEKLFEVAEMSAKLENKLRDVQEEIKGLDLKNKDILLPELEKQIPEV